MECLEDTDALGITLADFRGLCAALPKMEHFFMEKSIAGFMAAQRRILSLLTSSAKERYEQLVKRQPSLLQRVPKSQLAAYLGVSRETLSRPDL